MDDVSLKTTAAGLGSPDFNAGPTTSFGFRLDYDVPPTALTFGYANFDNFCVVLNGSTDCPTAMSATSSPEPATGAVVAVSLVAAILRKRRRS